VARCKPTGANVQPVGIKSEFSSSDAADRFLESLPSFPGNIAVTPSSPSSMTLPAGLTYPIERYLPSAGPYYDQNALLPVFGSIFFKYKPCMICWTCHTAAGYSNMSCGKVCKVCRTRRHPDEVETVLVLGSNANIGARAVHCFIVTEIGIASRKFHAVQRPFEIDKSVPTNKSSLSSVVLADLLWCMYHQCLVVQE